MKTNLRILSLVLTLLLLFFSSATLSGIYSQLVGINRISFIIYEVILCDLLNILFVVALLYSNIGIHKYIKVNKFDISHYLMFKKSSNCFIIYSVLSSIKLVVNQLFFGLIVHEYGVEQFSKYFLSAIFGISLLVIADFIKKAYEIQSENELTI